MRKCSNSLRRRIAGQKRHDEQQADDSALRIAADLAEAKDVADVATRTSAHSTPVSRPRPPKR